MDHTSFILFQNHQGCGRYAQKHSLAHWEETKREQDQKPIRDGSFVSNSQLQASSLNFWKECTHMIYHLTS